MSYNYRQKRDNAIRALKEYNFTEKQLQHVTMDSLIYFNIKQTCKKIQGIETTIKDYELNRNKAECNYVMNVLQNTVDAYDKVSQEGNYLDGKTYELEYERPSREDLWCAVCKVYQNIINTKVSNNNEHK